MTAPTLLHRPILGGVFGGGAYALATVSGVERGLHSVRYLVINPRTGAVVSAAAGKVEALAGARRVIRATDALARFTSVDAANDPHGAQADLWPELLPTAAPKPRRVSRRRRAIFERSGGLCHYCAATLTLDGKWHVEHMVPRALDGTDDAANLVAACAVCNLAKGDRTALEFVVLRQATSGSKP